MSFAILRHAKLQTGKTGTAIAHNHRTNTPRSVSGLEGDSGQAINIDSELSDLNERTPGNPKTRMDAKLPAKFRKDAVVLVELLLSASPEFFDSIEKDRRKLAKHPKFLDWCKTTREWVASEFGENVVDLSLHMDESTPHFHCLTVPLTKDGRLCAKEITSRENMQGRQTSYAKAVERFELNRGVSAEITKRRHIRLREEAPSAGGKVAQLESKLAQAKAEQVNFGLDAQAVINKANARILQLSHESKALKTGLASVEAELAKVKTSFASQQKLNISNFHLINKLEAEAKTMKKALQTATARDHELVAEITELRKQNANARPTPEQLKAVDHVLIDQARERMALEASKTAQEALSKEWAGIPIASKLDALHGTPVALYGRQVVLHMGRGKHVLHVVPDGQPMPKLQQTERQKNGIAR